MSAARDLVGTGAASPGDAPAPADIINRFANMQIVSGRVTDTGDLLIELHPPGRMSRRWLAIHGDFTITECDEWSPATYRNRRGITDQQHIDIGDDMYEREREDREP